MQIKTDFGITFDVSEVEGYSPPSPAILGLLFRPYARELSMLNVRKIDVGPEPSPFGDGGSYNHFVAKIEKWMDPSSDWHWAEADLFIRIARGSGPRSYAESEPDGFKLVTPVFQ